MMIIIMLILLLHFLKPDRNQVESRLNQIRDYIKVTATMIESLSRSSDLVSIICAIITLYIIYDICVYIIYDIFNISCYRILLKLFVNI